MRNTACTAAVIDMQVHVQHNVHVREASKSRHVVLIAGGWTKPRIAFDRIGQDEVRLMDRAEVVVHQMNRCP